MYLDILLLHNISQFLFLLLYALVPLLIGILIGWLLGQSRVSSLASQLKSQNEELESTKNQLASQGADYSSLKYKYDELEKDNQGLKSSLTSAQADIQTYRSQIEELESKLGVEGPSSSPQAPSALGYLMNYSAILRNDNLQIIEGVGPKIEELLKSKGVDTWETLASKSEAELEELLKAGGDAFRMHHPGTWPKQAQLASDGNWEALIAYQKELDTGKDLESAKQNPSKVERMMALMVTAEDDLQVVEGIGPKIERELNAAGIRTLRELANTSADRIREILAQHPRFKLANPNSWPRQAELAADGKWDELKEYQDYLEGGVDPSEKK